MLPRSSLRGTVPPPRISGPALYCIFSTVNTDRPMSCDEERGAVAEFMREFIAL